MPTPGAACGDPTEESPWGPGKGPPEGQQLGAYFTQPRIRLSGGGCPTKALPFGDPSLLLGGL